MQNGYDRYKRWPLARRLRYACCARLKAPREPKTRAAHSYLPNTTKSPATTDAHKHSHTRARMHRAFTQMHKGDIHMHERWATHTGEIQTPANAVTWTLLFVCACVAVRVCVLLWEPSEIWRGTAVLGCINYKKIMNRRKGKSACMQKRKRVRVCSLGIVPSCRPN